MTTEVQLDPADAKKRKHWLLLTIVQAAFGCFISPLLVYATGFEDFPAEAQAISKGFSILLMLGISAVFTSLYFYIMYRCAYLKHGNKWLIFQLTLSGVGTLISLPKMNQVHWNAFKICEQVLTTALFVGWIVLSVYLIEINTKIRLQKYLASDPYLNAVASIRDAKDLNELEARHKKAVEEAPRRYSKLLAEPYEKMKLQLSGGQVGIPS